MKAPEDKERAYSHGRFGYALKCNFINRFILPLIDFYPIGPRMGCNDFQMGHWAPSSWSLWSQFVRREAGTSDDKLLPDRKYREK